MTNHSLIKTRLLAKQRELSERLQATQATEGHEVEEGLDSNAQLWEVSEVRDGFDDEAAAELKQVDDALARLDAGEYGVWLLRDLQQLDRRGEVGGHASSHPLHRLRRGIGR